MTLNQLSDITQVLDIHDPSIRTTIEDLIEVRIPERERHLVQMNSNEQGFI